jgi:hypothetical protein
LCCVKYIIRHVMEDRFRMSVHSEWHPMVPKKLEMHPTYLGYDRVAFMFLDKLVYSA